MLLPFVSIKLAEEELDRDTNSDSNPLRVYAIDCEPEPHVSCSKILPAT